MQNGVHSNRRKCHSWINLIWEVLLIITVNEEQTVIFFDPLKNGMSPPTAAKAVLHLQLDQFKAAYIYHRQLDGCPCNESLFKISLTYILLR